MAELKDSKGLLADFKAKYKHSGPASVNLENLLELVEVLENVIVDIETHVPDFRYTDRLLKDNDHIVL
jgi:hypothetical protein